mgnify:CR=1 FL=1
MAQRELAPASPGRKPSSAGVRPGVLSYAVGWRSADFKAGNWVELLTSKYDPLSQTSSYSDAIADIRAWEED